jgi:hypothetical protein
MGENNIKKSRDDNVKADGIKNPWKYTTPNQGEPTTKDVEGITWHWCGKHQKWEGHKEAECLGVGVFVRRHMMMIGIVRWMKHVKTRHDEFRMNHLHNHYDESNE